MKFLDPILVQNHKNWETLNIDDYATSKAHMLYLVCNTLEERTELIEHLKQVEISAVFHYLSLHKSPFYEKKHDGRELPESDCNTDLLVRLPPLPIFTNNFKA